MRHFYDTWGKWLNRSPNNPDMPYADAQREQQPAAAS
jgi:hypothetical protein